jgi:hypothetical protein
MWRRRFFCGIFKVLIPDNLSAIVAQADAINRRFTKGWPAHAQARGFVTDPARVAHPQDKPGVDRWCDTCAATSAKERDVFEYLSLPASPRLREFR